MNAKLNIRFQSATTGVIKTRSIGCDTDDFSCHCTMWRLCESIGVNLRLTYADMPTLRKSIKRAAKMALRSPRKHTYDEWDSHNGHWMRVSIVLA